MEDIKEIKTMIFESSPYDFYRKLMGVEQLIDDNTINYLIDRYFGKTPYFQFTETIPELQII